MHTPPSTPELVRCQAHRVPRKRREIPEEMIGLPVRLKNARLALGLDGKRLATLSGVDAGTISRLESGKRVRVEGPVIIRLAKALHCGVGYLLADEPPPMLLHQRGVPDLVVQETARQLAERVIGLLPAKAVDRSADSPDQPRRPKHNQR